MDIVIVFRVMKYEFKYNSCVQEIDTWFLMRVAEMLILTHIAIMIHSNDGTGEIHSCVN